MPYAIGIDLGTSNSVVSIVKDGVPTVISDEKGNRTHPSVVWFAWGRKVEGDGILVGARAAHQVMLAPEGGVYSAKRLIGRTIDSLEVQKAREVVPYEILEGPHRDLRIRVHKQVYPLAEISAHVLRYLKGIAESYLGESVEQAVITVPAYFNDSQRQATRDAGRIAGLEVLRIINEPTAAALAYGLGAHRDENVAVYDLGGGTFDVSILRIQGDVFEVVSTAGDTYLGGDDFDGVVVDYLLGQLDDAGRTAVSRSVGARVRIKRAAEEAKKKLSFEEETTIYVGSVYTNEAGEEVHLKTHLTRVQFNQMVFPLVKRTFQVCDEALIAARLEPKDIAAVVMVGGMTRSLIIQEAVDSYFGRPPAKGINPDEVVSVGAAIQADSLLSAMQGNINPNRSLLIDVTPQSLGIATAGGFVERVIERNSSIPTGETRTFTTSWDDQQEVKIEVYQGEGRKIEGNQKLGEFILEGLRPAPRGEVKVSVSFDIDANGIVKVTAEDPSTRQVRSIRVEASAGLTEQEIEDLRFDREEDEGLAPSPEQSEQPGA
ncbi:MAG: molecular chaperone DnaK [Rickettsiales bacterium]|nr:molecular chaperone DnaK [Rickettsiales bacterium]